MPATNTKQAANAWKQAEREAHEQGRWFSTHCHAPKGSAMWRPHGARR